MRRASHSTRPWHDPRVRAVFYQCLVLGGVLLLGWYLVSNTLERLAQQSIATGFGFLHKEAGFAISESVIDYSPASNYGRAYLVGLLNTFKVGLVGILLATLIGTLVGIARLSRNWLIARLATVYVEGLRNIPLLLQLFLWYSLLTAILPSPRQALHPFEGVFLSNRGLRFPIPQWDEHYSYVLGAVLVGIAVAWGLLRWARQRQIHTGQNLPSLPLILGPILGLPLLTFWLSGASIVWDMPELRGFNFKGGLGISPEYTALLAGLTFYTASFIAEIVRSGILAVSAGQSEAAAALGLPPRRVLRLVILPQALRVIVPPLTSQYLNLIKNSSLAVAIGYPDLVSIANTTLNQTGQAVEGIAMIMATYLTISLLIAASMNWYNRSIAFKGR